MSLSRPAGCWIAILIPGQGHRKADIWQEHCHIGVGILLKKKSNLERF